MVAVVWGLMFCSTTILQAQEDENECAKKLAEAQELYNQGDLDRIESLIKDCMDKGFSHAEKLVAYKLLIKVNLFNDDYDIAEKNLILFLKHEPEYVVNKAVDPIEFINLFNTYKTIPKFSFGIRLGANRSSIIQQEEFGVYGVNTDGAIDESGSNGNFNTDKSYKGAFGFTGGAKAKMYLFDNVELNLDILYMTKSFQYQFHMFDFTGLTYKENQSWIAAPLSISLDFMKKKRLYPFVKIGGIAQLQLSSTANIGRVYNDEFNIQEVTGESETVFNLSDRNNSSRRTLNYWLMAGIGVKYKVPRGYFFLGLDYHYGLLDQQKPANRYNNSALTYKYYYVDDNFIMDNIDISVGYIRSLYKAKKKKVKVKTEGKNE